MAVVSETNRVYSYTTAKMKPFVKSEAGKELIEACLNQPPSQPLNCIEKQQPNPIKQHQPNPIKQQQPIPIEQQQPNPIEQQQPNPIEQQQPNPIEQQQPNPIEQQQQRPNCMERFSVVSPSILFGLECRRQQNLVYLGGSKDCIKMN